MEPKLIVKHGSADFMRRTLTRWSLCLLGLASCSRPIAQFTHTSKDYTAPAVVAFTNSSENAEFYEWNFGDGDSSVAQNPEHKFYRSGTYNVRLKAIKDNKVNEQTHILTIEKPRITMVEIQTPYGNMIAQLFDETPEHKKNFIKLAEEGFYDDLLFHRVIQGFMIQTGDPDSKEAPSGKALGMGGPGYTIPAEINKELIHKKGALAAARTGDAVNPEKRSSGSQFYVVQGTPLEDKDLEMIQRRTGLSYTSEQVAEYKAEGGVPFLDQNYTVFGQVIEGLEVIDSIANVKTDGRDRPLEDVKMTIRVID